MQWRHEPARVRACRRGSWVWIGLFSLRLAVQLALWRGPQADRTLDLLRTVSTCVARPETKEEPICRHFQAAEGTRTLDLLHGKQSTMTKFGHVLPANTAVPGFDHL